mmetsp:Transcript_38906/g.70165  ORF Transcript_38906/g.70165 Transcript_38906/m.70165 type:complete len:439 (+) Transcript_38906:72-1388(+)
MTGLGAVTYDDRAKLRFNYYGRFLRPNLYTATPTSRKATFGTRKVKAFDRRAAYEYLTSTSRPSSAREADAIWKHFSCHDEAKLAEVKRIPSRPPSAGTVKTARQEDAICVQPPASAGGAGRSAGTARRKLRGRPVSAGVTMMPCDPKPQQRHRGDALEAVKVQEIAPALTASRPRKIGHERVRPWSAGLAVRIARGPMLGARPTSAPPNLDGRQRNQSMNAPAFGSLYYQLRGKELEPGPGHYEEPILSPAPTPTAWGKLGSQQHGLDLESCEMYNVAGPPAYKIDNAMATRALPHRFARTRTDRNSRARPAFCHAEARFANLPPRLVFGDGEDATSAWIAWAQGLANCTSPNGARIDQASHEPRLEFQGAAWRLGGHLILPLGNDSGPCKPKHKPAQATERCGARLRAQAAAEARRSSRTSDGRVGGFQFGRSKRF